MKPRERQRLREELEQPLEKQRPFNGMKKVQVLWAAVFLFTTITLFAAPQLRLTSGADTITIVDGDANDQLASTPGVVYYNGPVGPNWTINVTIGITKPIQGTALEPYLDLDTTSVSQNAGDLEIEWTDTDFTATNGTWEAQAGGWTPTIRYSAPTIHWRIFPV
jgi:hypothetical protein